MIVAYPIRAVYSPGNRLSDTPPSPFLRPSIFSRGKTTALPHSDVQVFALRLHRILRQIFVENEKFLKTFLQARSLLVETVTESMDESETHQLVTSKKHAFHLSTFFLQVCE